MTASTQARTRRKRAHARMHRMREHAHTKPSGTSLQVFKLLDDRLDGRTKYHSCAARVHAASAEQSGHVCNEILCQSSVASAGAPPANRSSAMQTSATLVYRRGQPTLLFCPTRCTHPPYTCDDATESASALLQGGAAITALLAFLYLWPRWMGAHNVAGEEPSIHIRST